MPIRLFSAALFAVALLAGARALGDDEADRKTLMWVEQVVLRGEFFNKDDTTGTRKWVKAPRVSIFGGTPAQLKTAGKVIDALNDVFADTPIKKLELVGPNDKTAELKLHLAYQGQLAKVVQDNSLPKDLADELRKTKWTRFTWIYHNDKREITGALVGVANDPAFSREFEHNLLSTLLFVSGLCNTSSLEKDSLFWRDGVKRSAATKLSELDRKLIVWFYNHVPPDSKNDVVYKMFAEHWKK